MNPQPMNTAVPWWRIGHVWLVFAGPAVVVLASIVTAWIAFSGFEQEGLVDTTNPSSNVTAQVHCSALTPAIQGRNHAAIHLEQCQETGTLLGRQHPRGDNDQTLGKATGDLNRSETVSTPAR